MKCSFFELFQYKFSCIVYSNKYSQISKVFVNSPNKKVPEIIFPFVTPMDTKVSF